MKDDQDFFGVPEENILAAQRRTTGQRNPLHAVVPTKREIATLPPTQLKTALTDWMQHSATEIIPSRAQIALVREVLLRREDTSKLGPIISMCTNYIEGA